jgi:glycyl-tRNA synthetase
MSNENKMENIVSWAKRRGFIFQSSEIYGGIGGIYDFGPFGIALKNNIKRLWWKRFVEDRDDVVGIDSAILMNKLVWEASGHEKGFVDPLVECKKCNSRFREDQLKDEKCPDCGGELTESKKFNLMFKTFLGPVDDSKNMTYLRPETAQGMFTNFKNVLETSRLKIPFGIAQIGKSFRNEITMGEYLFRMREFEIAEIEFFVKPPSTNSGHGGEDEKWFDKWLIEWKDFVMSLGIKKENLVEYEHPKADLSHYSKRTIDLNYKFPFGTKELTGLANRTDYDLKEHEKMSGKDLKYFDQESGEKYLPFVIEPTLGIERLMLAIICDAYDEIEGGRTETTESAKEKEVVMHFDPSVAPVKVAILPLVKKLSKEATEIYKDIKKCFVSIYDEAGTIGRRYRRQDEIGTPFCVTFDFDSLKDKKVTVRDRDTMKQERIAIKDLKNYLWGKLGN